MTSRMLAADTVADVARRVLAAHGVPAAHAELQTDILVEAELRGLPSHGLQRLPRIAERLRRALIVPGEAGSGRWAAPALFQVDGRQGLGPVVAVAALDAVAARARTLGVAMAAIRDANHLGMLSWYVERVAAAGQVAIALSTSEALVHPQGGRRAMIGTNPVAVGVPTAAAPFVLDMATSLVPMGRIHVHALRGEPIPEGWALDADGNPTTDAAAAKHGAIAPFGGAKGYALGLGFELLVAALAGSVLAPDVRGTLDADHPCTKGDLFIVATPHHDGGLSQRLAAYLDAVRACAPADPASPVLVPGDRARADRARRLTEGIPVEDGLWTQLEALAVTAA